MKAGLRNYKYYIILIFNLFYLNVYSEICINPIFSSPYYKNNQSNNNENAVLNDRIKILSVEAVDETFSGKYDGKIIIKLSKRRNANYDVYYDMHFRNYTKVKKNVQSIDGKIILENMPLAEYYNIYVYEISSVVLC